MFFGLTESRHLLKPAHDKAIVTLLVGIEYLSLWYILSMKNWLAYADKFGFDVIAILNPIDESARAQSRSVAWQKLLILNQPWSKQYDRIVWLDSDIVISSAAPNILDSAPDRQKVGVCTEVQLSVTDKHTYHERLQKTQFSPTERMDEHFQYCARVYNHLAHGAHWQEEFNTGVMVFAPDQHNALLLELYNDLTIGTSARHEQPFLSDRINQRNLASFISKRFNVETNPILVLSQYWEKTLDEQLTQMFIGFLRNELKKSYFLHFAGSIQVMKMLAYKSQDGTNVLTDEL